ncbi:ABC-three component system protein [Desulfosporosinus nitroreducens]|uniref:ABC-three component systems C-terminal domain-containing protein n=1 Tax=Desulfosporosinus nitroreducens TaxID=2018668 RepID=A0ABT8QWZ9_9FIRM|nr:ABC-three component system protein [Desulfosporosinus nitroreducens]MDO0825867.1 hypothetical protein [Desulfosporosinus nitroreducens]
MGRKKRGNDAIPTWSGFNYQGKAMLLNILNKINELLPLDIKEYIVEIERQEDFVIICNGQSQSFCQVKATLSKSKWSAYSEALDKLLEHRNKSDNPTAKCIFIVAKEITDWNDKSNTYSSEIEIFKHSGKIVDICDVKQSILSEIKLFNRNNGHPIGHEEVIYGELCLFLDYKVAEMHTQSYKKRKYKIKLLDFVDVITKALQQQQARQEFYVKERVFEHVTQTLQNSLSEICQYKCGKTLSNCEVSCAAKTAFLNMIKLPNLPKYCKVINPDRIDGWENELQYVANMPGDKISSAIYPVFYESRTPEKVDENGDVVYLHTAYCQAEKQYIIPTLLDLSSCCNYGTNSLQNTFQSIKNNKEILDVLEGSGITAIPGYWGGSLSQADICTSWKNAAEDEPDNINNFYRGIEIISIAELLEVFRHGGNKDK